MLFKAYSFLSPDGPPIVHNYKRRAKKGKEQPQVGSRADDLSAETAGMTKKNCDRAELSLYD